MVTKEYSAASAQFQDPDIGPVIDAFQENEGNRPMRSYTPGSKNKGNLGKVGTYRGKARELRENLLLLMKGMIGVTH